MTALEPTVAGEQFGRILGARRGPVHPHPGFPEPTPEQLAPRVDDPLADDEAARRMRCHLRHAMDSGMENLTLTHGDGAVTEHASIEKVNDAIVSYRFGALGGLLGSSHLSNIRRVQSPRY